MRKGVSHGECANKMPDSFDFQIDPWSSVPEQATITITRSDFN